MQVQNINSTQYNYSKNNQPNFTAIKSIRCEGLYKNQPKLAQGLLDTFKHNEKAMSFCKKYNVDIVFYAKERFAGVVESSIHLFVENISKSKLRTFFDKLLNNKDEISISAFANNYTTPKNLEASSEILMEMIGTERKVNGKWKGGILDAHLDTYDRNIENELMKKADEKKSPVNTELISRNEFKDAKQRLDDSINDLLNNTK